MIRFVVSICVVLTLMSFSGCKATATKAEAAPLQTAAATAEQVPATVEAKPVEAVAAQAAPQSPAEPTGTISFDSTTHDFGNIDPDSKNNAEFKFTNTGKGKLKMGQIQTTCGCTVAALDKNEYAPGESGVVKIEYHAAKHPGPVTKQLYIASNDATNPRVELILKANIVLKVEYKPDTLKLKIDKDNAGAEAVTIKSIDGKEFSIKSFQSANNVLSAKVDPNAVATSFTIPLTVDIEKLRSNLNGSIQFFITHPSIDVITIAYSTPAEYEAQPGSIIIRDAKPGEKVKREIWIKSNYDKPFEIDSVTSSKGIVKLESQEKIENTYKLNVVVEVPADNKMMFFSDTLAVKVKGGTELTVNCRGFYTRARK